MNSVCPGNQMLALSPLSAGCWTQNPRRSRSASSARTVARQLVGLAGDGDVYPAAAGLDAVPGSTEAWSHQACGADT